MTTAVPRKDQRIEFRASREDRDLFVRAAHASGMDLSTFANQSLRVAAQRVLADRTEFILSPVEAALFDALMERPAQELAGLTELMNRPSPFID